MGHILTLMRRSGALPEAGAPDSATVSTAWTGLVAADGVTVNHTVSNAVSAVRLAVSTSAGMTGPVYSAPAASVQSGSVHCVRHTITGLAANTTYYYGLEIGGVISTAKQGRFRTLPDAGHFSFTFAFGNCNSGASNAIFSRVEEAAPLFVQHLGDLYYDDIDTDDVNLFHAALNGRLNVNPLGLLMRQRPFYWIWGDHDFCGDGSDASSTGKPAALAAYNARVPMPATARYAMGAGDPVGYAYTVGRFRFIVPDQRSARIGDTVMWGGGQKDWIEDQMLAAAEADRFIVYVNESVLDGEYSATDRAWLANLIKDNGLEGRVLMLGGDAHSIQIDDGTNNDYATGGGGKMIVLHAGPFSQGNSFKGGPWSHGQFGGNTNQAGILQVTDTGGDAVDCLFTGINGDGAHVVEFPFRLSLTGYIAPPIYTITAGADTVSEGGSVDFDITSNRPGEVIEVFLSGVSAGDIVGGDLSPNVTLDGGGAGTLTVELVEDELTEGAETLTARIGKTVFQDSVAINDTSVAPAPGAFEIVQHASGQGSGTAGTGGLGSACQLPLPASAGNLLVLYCASDKTSGAITPSPALSGGWSMVAEHLTGSGVSAGIFYGIAEGGEQTFAFTTANVTTKAAAVIEISLAHGTDPIGEVVTGGTPSSTSRQASLTTSGSMQAGSLALAFFHNDGAASSDAASSFYANTGYAIIENIGMGSAAPNSTPPGLIVAWKAIAAATAQSVTIGYAGDTADENWAALIEILPQ